MSPSTATCARYARQSSAVLLMAVSRAMSSSSAASAPRTQQALSATLVARIRGPASNWQSRRAFSNKTRAVLGSISSARPNRAGRLNRSQLSPATPSSEATPASAASMRHRRQRGSGGARSRGSPIHLSTRFDHSILNSNKAWEGIIFDKDGTLVNQTQGLKEWARVVGAHFEEHCGADAKERLFDLLRVNPATGEAQGEGILAMRPWNEIYDTVSSELCRWTGMKFHEASSLVCTWRASVDLAKYQTPLFDIVPVFSALKEQGIKVAISTADDRDVTTRVLDELGVLPFVDCLVTGSDMFSPKPQAASALYITQRLQMHPENCIMVGDTLADMLLARNAGLGLGVAVLSGAGTRQQLVSYTDVIVDRADEVLGLVQGHPVEGTATPSIDGAVPPAPLAADVGSHIPAIASHAASDHALAVPSAATCA